jgi:hypothetical protein
MKSTLFNLLLSKNIFWIFSFPSENPNFNAFCSTSFYKFYPITNVYFSLRYTAFKVRGRICFSMASSGEIITCSYELFGSNLKIRYFLKKEANYFVVCIFYTSYISPPALANIYRLLPCLIVRKIYTLGSLL